MKGTKALSFAVDWTRLRAKSGQMCSPQVMLGVGVGRKQLLKEVERVGK